MAAGFFAKLLALGKKIVKPIVHVVDKAREVGAKIISHAMPVLEKIPVIGTAAKAFEPAINYTSTHGGNTLVTPPLEWVAKKFIAD